VNNPDIAKGGDKETLTLRANKVFVSKLPSGLTFASGKFLTTPLAIRFTTNPRTSSSALSTKGSGPFCSLRSTSATALARSRPGVTHNSATFEHLYQSTFAIQGACRGTFFHPMSPLSTPRPIPITGSVPPAIPVILPVISPDFHFFPLSFTSRPCLPGPVLVQARQRSLLQGWSR
jgi:hypothetical protein